MRTSVICVFPLLALSLLSAVGGVRPASAASVVVSGRLVGAAGSPVAGASVELLAYPSAFAVRAAWAAARRPQATERVTTNPQGRFTAHAAVAGLWVLRVRAAGFAEVVVPLLPLVRSQTLADIELPTARVFAVHVLDADGKAIPDALVVVRPRPDPRARVSRRARRQPLFPRSQSARTGAEGQARLVLPAGVSLRVMVAARGYVPRKVESGAGKKLDIVLRSGQRRLVLVRDPQGKPAAGALIVVGQDDLPVADTDAKGRAWVSLGVATTELSARSPGGLRGTVRIQPTHAAHPGKKRPGKEPSAGEHHALVTDGQAHGDRESAETPVVIDLPADIEITGTVVDKARDEGIADALVFTRSVEPAATHTDTRGRYRLHIPPSSRFVQAAKDGYRSNGAALERGEDTSLVLEEAGALRGRVVDEHGEPIEDAEVRSLGPVDRLSMWRGDQIVDRSDAQGHFALAPVAVDQTVVIEARHQGFAPAELDALVAAGAAAEPIEIVLSPGRVAIGLVVDAGGQPIAGARVSMLASAPSGRSDMGYLRRLMQRVATEVLGDAEGRFRIEDLGPGRFDLLAEHQGYAPTRVAGVSIPAEQAVADVGTLVMPDGETLEGQVVDPEGQGVAGASVSIREHGSGFSAMFADRDQPDATTDANGRFAVHDLQPEGTVHVSVQCDGYGDTSRSNVRVPAKELLRIELVPGVNLDGVVIDAKGMPIQGAAVQARREGQSFKASFGKDRTDAEGQFTVETLVPGSWSLLVTAAGFQQAEKSGIVIEAGSTPEPLRIQLARGSSVVGTVTGGEGQPLADVLVRLNPGGELRRPSFVASLVTTKSDGSYRLEGLPSGRHVLSFEHGHHRRAVRDVEVGPDEVRLDVTLEPGLEIVGRVVDGEGMPIPGVAVAARPATVVDRASTFRAYMERKETDSEGRFRITGLEPGSYRVEAKKRGFATAYSESPIRIETTSIEGIELWLGPGGAIVGRVLGLSFDQRSRAQLFVTRIDQAGVGDSLMANIDHDGRFRIENVAAGRWQIIATAGDSRIRRQTVTLSQGSGEVTADLDFGGGFTVTGTVRVGGVAEAGLSVTARGRDHGDVSQAITDSAGRYRFEGIAAGRYDWIVTRRGMRGRQLASRTVDVAGDDVFDLEIAESTLTGRVLDADGAPIGHASVSLSSAGDSTAALLARLMGGEAHSAENGRFELRGISPGTYRLRVEHEGFASVSWEIVIEAGQTASTLDVVLEPSTGLKLLVRRASGQPVRSVSVGLLNAEGGVVEQGSYVVGEAGDVRLARIGTGIFTLLVRGEATATTEMQVQVPSSAAPIIVLSPAGSLHVRVPAARDAGKIELTLRRGGRPKRILGSYGRLLDRWDLVGGEVLIGGLDAGPIALHVTLPDGHELAAQTVVQAGQTVEVELR